MKILLRHFNISDGDCISQKIFPGATADEVAAMIKEWGTLQYKGSYFEMFAVETDFGVAGYVSLYEIDKNASVGLEVISEHRCKGIGHHAVMQVMCYAKESGYKKATARVLTDNLPSLKLCEKSGFKIADSNTTPAGKPVYCLEKVL